MPSAPGSASLPAARFGSAPGLRESRTGPGRESRDLFRCFWRTQGTIVVVQVQRKSAGGPSWQRGPVGRQYLY